MKQKTDSASVFSVILGSSALLFVRYFVYVIYNTIKSSGVRSEPTESGIAFVTFEPTEEAIMLYTPLLALHILIAAFAVVFAVLVITKKMGCRGGIISCAVIGTCTLSEAVYIRILDYAASANMVSRPFPDMSLSCFLAVRFYSPFGIFGEEGINLKFLTHTMGFYWVRYVFLGIILLLSWIDFAMFIVRKRKNSLPAPDMSPETNNK